MTKYKETKSASADFSFATKVAKIGFARKKPCGKCRLILQYTFKYLLYLLYIVYSKLIIEKRMHKCILFNNVNLLKVMD